MIQARIISVENPTLEHKEAPGTSHLHPKFVKRRQHVEKMLLPQIKSFGFKNVEIFPALTSADFTYTKGAEGDTIDYRNHHLKALYDFGNGCNLSHYVLYEQCIALGETMLILEDDAWLPADNIANTLEAIFYYDSLPDNGDILYLQSELPYDNGNLHSFPEKTHLFKDGPLIKLSACSDLSGSAAYCVRPMAARKLMERSHEIALTCVDGTMHYSFNEHRIGILIQKEYAKGFMLNNQYA